MKNFKNFWNALQKGQINSVRIVIKLKTGEEIVRTDRVYGDKNSALLQDIKDLYMREYKHHGASSVTATFL
jgi:hypothetical protein